MKDEGRNSKVETKTTPSNAPHLFRHSNLTPTFPGVPDTFGKVTDPSDNSQLTPLPGSRAVSDNSGQFAINLAEKQPTPNLGPEFASERQSLNEAGEALAQPVVGKSDVSLGGTAATPKQTPGEAGISASTLPVLLQWHYVPPKIPETGMVGIIYARKSSDKQREDQGTRMQIIYLIHALALCLVLMDTHALFRGLGFDHPM